MSSENQIAKNLTEEAKQVFGNPEKADVWLNKPNKFLGGKKPIDTAVQSEEGLAAVQNLLGQIEHGINP